MQRGLRVGVPPAPIGLLVDSWLNASIPSRRIKSRSLRYSRNVCEATVRDCGCGTHPCMPRRSLMAFEPPSMSVTLAPRPPRRGARQDEDALESTRLDLDRPAPVRTGSRGRGPSRRAASPRHVDTGLDVPGLPPVPRGAPRGIRLRPGRPQHDGTTCVTRATSCDGVSSFQAGESSATPATTPARPGRTRLVILLPGSKVSDMVIPGDPRT